MVRYEKVFTLTPMLYTDGSPVIIEAGALQKYNVNGNIIAQLKFKSISAKAIIKALTVKIVPLDISGNPIGEEIEHQYLDLSVKRDENFGSNEPIILSDNTTRGFSVFVTKIVFDDNTDVILEKSEWSALPEQNIISLDSVENKYFHNKYLFEYPKQALKYKDLWLCSCGAINHYGEEKCCCCNNDCNEMLNFDYEELKYEAHYNYACDLLSQSTISSVNSAINEFKQITEYKDVEAKLSEAENVLSELNKNLSESKKKRKKLIISTATIVCVCIVFGIVLKSAIIPSVKYHSAVKMMTNGEYVESVKKFESLGDYKDSVQKATNAKLEIIKTAKVGDKVSFGSYEQDSDTSNGKEDMAWIVLEKKDDSVLMVSEKIIECKKYHEVDEDVTWAECTLRNWLNNDFINIAFKENEISRIKTSLVSTEGDELNQTDGGVDVNDKVFLLSENEAKKYFVSDSERICIGTSNAVNNGLYINEQDDESKGEWWLRSPGDSQDYAMIVKPDGYVGEVTVTGTLTGGYQEKEIEFTYKGGLVDSDYIGVRPAMWITVE